MNTYKQHFIERWIDDVGQSNLDTPTAKASMASPNPPRRSSRLRDRKPAPLEEPVAMAPAKRKRKKAAPAKGMAPAAKKTATTAHTIRRTRLQAGERDAGETTIVHSTHLAARSHTTHVLTSSHGFKSMTTSQQRSKLKGSTPPLLFEPAGNPSKPAAVQELVRRLLRGIHDDVPNALK